jgi:transposase-like protein
MRVEVLDGVERRRRWSHDDKLRIVEETLALGAKVTEVARRNGIAASVVFTWRRQARTIEKVGPCFASMQIAVGETSEENVKPLSNDDRRLRPSLLRCVELRSDCWHGRQTFSGVFQDHIFAGRALKRAHITKYSHERSGSTQHAGLWIDGDFSPNFQRVMAFKAEFRDGHSSRSEPGLP